MNKQASLWLLIAGLLACAMAYAGPSGQPLAPYPDQHRAYTSLDWAASGAFVQGQWALKMVAHRKAEDGHKIVLPIEALGGFDSLHGRWQRVLLPQDRQYLLERYQVWDLSAKVPTPMNAEGLLEELRPGLGLTWEDFSFIFLSWSQRNYLGVERVRGRYCDIVEVRPLEGGQSARVWLDTEFGAPLQIETFDADNMPHKTIRAVSLQKLENQWILRRWDLRNHSQGFKIKVEVTAVALDQKWSSVLQNKRKNKWPDTIEWNQLK